MAIGRGWVATGAMLAAGSVLALAGPRPADAASAKKPPPPVGRLMAAAEIQAFIQGGQIESTAPDGTKAEILHRPDGTSAYELIRGEKRTKINGIWTIRGNQFCRKFDRPKETEVCLDYRRIDERTVGVYNEGKLIARQTRP